MNIRIRALIMTAVFLLVPSSASAQQRGPELSLTGQPRSWLVQGEPYVVKGYRSIRLGMSVDAVKALLAKGRPESMPTLKDEVDPVARTRGLAIVVADLPPGPGPATISYVFGAASGRLIAINIYWLLEGNPSQQQRESLVAAGTTLASGFVGWQWPMLATARGHVLGPGVLVLYSGKDEAGGGVEVRLDGVAFEVESPQRAGAPPVGPVHRPAPAGPAQLRLSFVANVDTPDIQRIPAGSF